MRAAPGARLAGSNPSWPVTFALSWPQLAHPRGRLDWPVLTLCTTVERLRFCRRGAEALCDVCASAYASTRAMRRLVREARRFSNAARAGKRYAASSSRPTWREWPIAAAMLIVVIISAAAALTIPRQPAAYPMRFAIPVIGEVSQLALSSDGRLLAFVTPDETTGKNILSVQAIGQQQATPLAGTQGENYPFWSPDAAYVGFFANGNLMKVRSSGGPAQTIVAVTHSARGASWGSKNIIVYSRIAGGPLWRVNADGSGASVLTDRLLTPEERSHRWPMFLPDGDRFLFWAGDFSKEGARSGIYLSSLSKRQKAFLVEARSNVGFAQNGYLFYVDEKGGLAMQAFDSKRRPRHRRYSVDCRRSRLSTVLVLGGVRGLCQRHCGGQSDVGRIPIGSHVV